MKRLLSLLLILSLLIPVSTYGVERQEGGNDVYSYNQTYGQLLKELGLITGDDSGNIMADKTITRAEMAVVLARMSTGQDLVFEDFVSPTKPTFSDVPNDHWSYDAVEYIASVDITYGDGHGHYMPDELVTYGQVLLFLTRVWPKFYNYDKANNDMTVAEMSITDQVLLAIPDYEYNAEVYRKDLFALMISFLSHKNKVNKTLFEEKNLYNDKVPTKEAFDQLVSYCIYEPITYEILESTTGSAVSTEALKPLKEGLTLAKYQGFGESLAFQSILDGHGGDATVHGINQKVYGEDQYVHISDLQDSNDPYLLFLAVTYGVHKDTGMNFEIGYYNRLHYFTTEAGSEIYVLIQDELPHHVVKPLYIVAFRTYTGRIGYYMEAGGVIFEYEIDAFE